MRTVAARTAGLILYPVLGPVLYPALGLPTAIAAAAEPPPVGSASDVLEIPSPYSGGPTAPPGSFFGVSTAAIGDVNNDGTTDLAVGALGLNNGQGGVYICLLNPDGSVLSWTLIASGVGGGPTLATGDNFGRSVAPVGDLNGDTIPDLAVGAPGTDLSNVGGNAGAVYILTLSQNGEATSSMRIDANTPNGPDSQPGGSLGSALASLGDLNGDNIADLAAGAFGEDSSRGAVYTMRLTPSGLPSQTRRIAIGSVPGLALDPSDLFGFALTSVGDINTDGRTELIVGAQQDDDAGQDTGALYVLSLNPSGTAFTLLHKISALTSGPALDATDRFGTGLATIFDINEDGIPDIAAGSQTDDDGASNAGALYVITLAADGSATSSVKISATTGGGPELASNSGFGFGLSFLGDLESDENPELVAGAPFRNSAAGAAFVLSIQSIPPSITITQQPASQLVPAGDPAVFQIQFEATDPPTFQWRRNGIDLADSTKYFGTQTATLAFLADDLDEAIYDCVITIPGATEITQPAVLAVEGDPIDFDENGMIDFFDIMAFLAAFDERTGG